MEPQSFSLKHIGHKGPPSQLANFLALKLELNVEWRSDVERGQGPPSQLPNLPALKLELNVEWRRTLSGGKPTFPTCKLAQVEWLIRC